MHTLADRRRLVNVGVVVGDEGHMGALLRITDELGVQQLLL